MAEKMREFGTGATRDLDDNKLDFEGFLSPLALERFAQYMHEHRRTANGVRASDDWQKGIPLEVYIKSLLRHAHEVWKLHRIGYVDERQMEDALCGVWFNTQGYLLELIKKRGGAS